MNDKRSSVEELILRKFGEQNGSSTVGMCVSATLGKLRQTLVADVERSAEQKYDDWSSL